MPTVLSKLEVQRIWSRHGCNMHGQHIQDKNFSFPLRSWVQKDLWPYWEKQMDELLRKRWANRTEAGLHVGDKIYLKEEWDCENMAHDFSCLARRLHTISPNTPPKTGLLLGPISYIDEDIGAHAIVTHFDREDPDNQNSEIIPWFLEEQNGKEKWLSPKEKSSIYFSLFW